MPRLKSAALMGWCAGILAIAFSTIGAIPLSQQASDDQQQALAIREQKSEIVNRDQRLLAAHARIAMLSAQLRPLCGGPPPTIQALLLVTQAPANLHMHVTSEPNAPATIDSEQAAALTVNASAVETDLVRWIERVDNDPLIRTSVSLEGVSRPGQSQDLTSPAQASRVDATMTIDAYQIDRSACKELGIVTS
jgi:hypothetical protein